MGRLCLCGCSHFFVTNLDSIHGTDSCLMGKISHHDDNNKGKNRTATMIESNRTVYK